MKVFFSDSLLNVFFLMKCTVVYEQRVNNVENCKN